MNRLNRRACMLAIGAILVLGGCGGGGSGGGTSDASGGDGDVQYRVVVQTSEGGDASPLEQEVAEGDQASIDLTPEAGFRVGSASGCGGTLEGDRYLTAPLTADCEVTVEFIRSGGVSGTLVPPPEISVDESLNDARSSLEDNGRCESAQEIESRITLHGFASAEPTGGDTSREHFAEDSNRRDFYRVYLEVGQSMQLEVADYQEGEYDLALYLWNGDCSRQVEESDSGETEEVTSLLGGEHVVEVRAKSGVGKYVLRGASSWDTAESDEQLVELSDRLPALAPYEVILTFEPDAGNQAHDALSQALNQALGVELSFHHRDGERATLASINGLPASDSGLSEAMKLLPSINPDAFEKLDTLRMVDFLAQQPGVRYAEPNVVLASQRTPDDPGYSDQWHYDQISLPAAWDDTVGAPADGDDVVVAVLDTGVYKAHEDLQAKLLAGYDFHDGDADPDETSGASSWHGTHVSGTVGATTNNGTGVAGASWATRILPVRVLGDDGGSRYNVIQGVRYSAGMTNDSGGTPSQSAEVINMSLGGGGHSRSEQDLYHQVRDRGISIVAAAGNDGSNEPMYPAAYDGVLSVSATNCNEELTGYSNFGPTISLAAPGGDDSNCGLFASGAVLSTVGEGSGGSRTSSYGYLAGTSMATPHVSGVLALMYALYPDLTPADVDALLADGQLTDDLGDEGRDDDFGHGQINAKKSVDAARALAEGDQQPARVVVDPATLFMGQDSEAVLQLRQEGEGEAPAVTDWQSGASWLSAEAQDVDEGGLGTYRVLVDRSEFSEEDRGDYQSELTFTLSDGSELSASVHIQVGTALQTAPVYVMLLDPESGEVAYQVPAARTEAGDLNYRLEGVEPGDYRLMAGSDVDVDGFICQPGEVCGAYPDYDNRETLTVTDEVLEERDFAVDILTRFRPLGGAAPEPVARQ